MRVGETRDIGWEESATIAFSISNPQVNVTKPDGTAAGFNDVDAVTPIAGTLSTTHRFKELTELNQGGVWNWLWKYTNNNNEIILREDERFISFNDAQQLARLISGLTIQDRQFNAVMIPILRLLEAQYPDCIAPYRNLSEADAYWLDLAIANMALGTYYNNNPTQFSSANIKSVSDSGLSYTFATPPDSSPAQDLLIYWTGRGSTYLNQISCVKAIVDASPKLSLFGMAGPRTGAQEKMGVASTPTMNRLLMELEYYVFPNY